MTYAGQLIYSINTAPDNIFTSIFNDDFELAESMSRRSTYKAYIALQFLKRIRQGGEPSTPAENDLAAKLATVDISDIGVSHYLPVRQRWRPFIQTASDYMLLSPSGTAMFEGEVVFTFDRQDNFRLLGDLFIYVELTGLAAIPPTNVPAQNADYDFVNYADYPAHVLFSSIKLRGEQAILDELIPSTYNNHYNFALDASQKLQWKALVGQESAKYANVMADPAIFPFREQRIITDGLQTPKAAHPFAEFCLPLLFDFPKRKNVLPSPVLVDSKISIVCTLNKLNLVCESNKSRPFVAPTFKKIFMGARYIYCGDAVRDILVKSSQLNLTRLHRFQRTEVVTAIAEIDLKTIRGPTEWIIINVRPSSQVLSGSDGALQTWYMSGKITPVVVPFAMGIYTTDTQGNSLPVAAGQIGFYNKVEETIVAVELVLGSNTIYSKSQALVSSAYLPYEFKTRAEYMPGTHFIPFATLFKKYQPSGYVDTVSGGGMILRITTHASTYNPMLVDVSAESLNFVKITNGTAQINFV